MEAGACDGAERDRGEAGPSSAIGSGHPNAIGSEAGKPDHRKPDHRKPDHRKAVAAARRQRMERRLVEAAIFVVAARGSEALSIDDIISEAGVARGTFYKYFVNVDQVLLEAKGMLGGEIMQLVLDSTPPVEDPAETMAHFILSFFATFRRYPLMGEFVACTGLAALDDPATLTAAEQFFDALEALLALGRAADRFIDMPPGIAFDFMRVGVVMSLRRSLAGHPPDDAETTAALLRLYGVPAQDAARLGNLEGRSLEAPQGGLIERSEKIRWSRPVGLGL
ncbi:hypothetical protein PSAL_000040 [Pseudooceanicola algae]|uniref:Uncharacterized protein n=2 Tax=Pseudooceanicola algae TaxID=1537215 RepID=A0A418SJZ0_9RHOB|nr:hypothetical protein PSAL_000040 [Pseudooceanicola algae]